VFLLPASLLPSFPSVCVSGWLFVSVGFAVRHSTTTGQKKKKLHLYPESTSGFGGSLVPRIQGDKYFPTIDLGSGVGSRGEVS
jgi:hypothetical protein